MCSGERITQLREVNLHRPSASGSPRNVHERHRRCIEIRQNTRARKVRFREFAVARIRRGGRWTRNLRGLLRCDALRDATTRRDDPQAPHPPRGSRTARANHLRRGGRRGSGGLFSRTAHSSSTTTPAGISPSHAGASATPFAFRFRPRRTRTSPVAPASSATSARCAPRARTSATASAHSAPAPERSTPASLAAAATAAPTFPAAPASVPAVLDPSAARSRAFLNPRDAPRRIRANDSKTTMD